MLPEEKKQFEQDECGIETKFCPICGFQMVSAGGSLYGRYKCYKCVKIFDFTAKKVN